MALSSEDRMDDRPQQVRTSTTTAEREARFRKTHETALRKLEEEAQARKHKTE
jgi:hypothetical protein